MQFRRSFIQALCLAGLAACDSTSQAPLKPAAGAPTLPAPTVSAVLTSAGGLYASANLPRLALGASGMQTTTTLTVFQVFRNPGCTGTPLSQTTVPASGAPLAAQASVAVTAPASTNYFSANYFFVDADGAATSAASYCSNTVQTTNPGNPDVPLLRPHFSTRDLRSLHGRGLRGELAAARKRFPSRRQLGDSDPLG